MCIISRVFILQTCPFLKDVRSISTSTIFYKQYLSRQGKMINKIMNGGSRKKKFYDSPNVASHLPSLSSVGKGQPGAPTIRRIAVLNKLFMKHVTDLMATGEISPGIIGHGIEISRVKVCPDFKALHVYWLAKGSVNDIKIEQILTDNAIKIRHELSQLRVMGQVPKIEFMKDKQYAKIAEVDQLLSVADFGEDFEPIDPSHRLKNELTLNITLPQDLKDKINLLQNDEEKMDDITDPDDPLPPMRMDTLGIDHSEILNKVMKSLKQTKLAWKQSENNVVYSNDTITSRPISTVTDVVTAMPTSEQKEQFTKFLMNRQLQKQKALRRDTKYSDLIDREHLQSELEKREREFNDQSDIFFESNLKNDDDYYDEDIQEDYNK